MAVRNPLVQIAGEFAELPATDVLKQIGVYAYRTTNISVVNNTSTVVGFDEHNANFTTGMHDKVTNNSRLTAVREGWHRIVANVRWDNANAGETTTRQVHIRKNGTGAAGVARICSIPADGADHGGVWDIYLIVGDYIELLVTHQHGSNLLLIAVATFAPSLSMFLK